MLTQHPQDPFLAFEEGRIYGLYRADAVEPAPAFTDANGIGWDDAGHTQPACVAVARTEAHSVEAFFAIDPKTIEF